MRVTVAGALCALGLAAAGQIAAAKNTSLMTFGDGCAEGDTIVIAAVGDLLFHNKLQRLALHTGRGYSQFWKPIAGTLRAADMTYGNLEGPTAEGLRAGGYQAKDPGKRVDRIVYGYKPPFLAFNFHPSVLKDIQAAGFDILSTANNHSLDRGALGVDRTIANLKKTGLAFTGTRLQEPEPDHRWARRLTENGVTVSWIACTTFTNGWKDKRDQVLYCQNKATVEEIRREAADPAVDAVILTPHWGWENKHYPNAEQKKIAANAIEAGATAVIGAHPHVLQPWRKHVAKDGREGLIIYSLGNFISNQRRQPQRVGAVAFLELTKPAHGAAELSAVGYTPTWVRIDRHGVRTGEASPKAWASRHATKIFPGRNRVRAANFRALPRPSCDTPRAPLQTVSATPDLAIGEPPKQGRGPSATAQGARAR